MIKCLERLDRTIDLDFWRNHLQGATPTPFLQSFPGAARVIANATATRKVQIGHGLFTQQFGIMESTLVTCAWSIALAVHSRCADVVLVKFLLVVRLFCFLIFLTHRAILGIPSRDIDSMMDITINTVIRQVILATTPDGPDLPLSRSPASPASPSPRRQVAPVARSLLVR
jgi:hypothetical protein